MVSTDPVVIIKSANHFLKGFGPLAAEILYTDDDGDGHATCDPRYVPYTHTRLKGLWPMVMDPHNDGAEDVPWASTSEGATVGAKL